VLWYVNLFNISSELLTTLASSTIIEEIEALGKSGLASLGFFYHDFRDDQKKDRRGLLSSLIVQLCYQSNPYCDKLTEFYLEHGSGSQQPSDSALLRCLLDILKFPGQAPVYLIVDALDECSNISAMPSSREKVLELVEKLIDSRLPNLHICVTSRPETDIKSLLGPLTFRAVSLHDESGQMEDIENYIKSVVNKDPKNRRWTAEDKKQVIGALTKNADGMYGTIP
jgi:NACHT domain